MKRRLRVTVDQSTWPTHPNIPAFPSTFRNGTHCFDLNIPELLMCIGVLTTPAHSAGVSLSEFWAWVRYLHAVSDDTDLRLTRPFFDLDAHQKTILSDDFGIGAPICWLMDHLQLELIADGRYFIDRMATSVGTNAAKPAKRGPGKSPDFVALDTSGVWHIIECKGTQSGSTYRERQLGSLGPPATGAVAQKRTIAFPPGYTGQRLACGLALAVEGGADVSSLRVIDPPAIGDFVVEEDHIVYAVDAMRRASGARSLRLAGFSAASSALSAPSGIRPDSQPTMGIAEQSRQGVIAEKTVRARDELRNREQHYSFSAAGESYFGREVQFDLPTPIGFRGPTSQSLRLLYGVNVHFLDELERRPLTEEPLSESDTAWHEMIGGTNVESEGLSARMQIGSLFLTEISLAD